MPKTGLEPITVSYKETVLPIKLFRLPYIYAFFILFLPPIKPLGINKNKRDIN